MNLKNIYDKLNQNINLFNGLVLSNISIDKKLELNYQYNNSFYQGVQEIDNKLYKVSLMIPNNILKEFLKTYGYTQNASYDITINSLKVDGKGNIRITVKELKENGVSYQELLKRKLILFCENNNYFNRHKKELPKLITNILAITSKNSTIENDLKNNLKMNNITFKYCSSSEEISQEILQNQQYDIIVLYRGGHEDEAMQIFSNEEVIVAINLSKIPVCAALGHDIDKPFIYNIADQTFSTPSAFAKEIVNINNKYLINMENSYLNTISELKKHLNNNIEHMFNENNKQINYLKRLKLYYLEENYKKSLKKIESFENNYKLNLEKKQKRNYIFIIILIISLGYFIYKGI